MRELVGDEGQGGGGGREGEGEGEEASEGEDGVESSEGLSASPVCFCCCCFWFVCKTLAFLFCLCNRAVVFLWCVISKYCSMSVRTCHFDIWCIDSILEITIVAEMC